MGKHKTDRTQQLHEAARRYTLAQQVNRAIEQHNFTKLIRQGTVVLDRQAEGYNWDCVVRTALNEMKRLNRTRASMLISEGRTVGKPPPPACYKYSLDRRVNRF